MDLLVVPSYIVASRENLFLERLTTKPHWNFPLLNERHGDLLSNALRDRPKHYPPSPPSGRRSNILGFSGIDVQYRTGQHISKFRKALGFMDKRGGIVSGGESKGSLRSSC